MSDYSRVEWQHLCEILPLDSCSCCARLPQAEQRRQLRTLPPGNRRPHLRLLFLAQLTVVPPAGKGRCRHAGAPLSQQCCRMAPAMPAHHDLPQVNSTRWTRCVKYIMCEISDK